MRDKADYIDHPWTLERTRHERPDDRRQAELEDRDALISELPAGSISGGEVIYDPDDRSTHWMSPDPDERQFAKDFYGIMSPGDPDNPNPGTLPNEGLSRSEKRILHGLAEKEVWGGFDTDGVHRDGMNFQQMDRDQKALVDAGSELYAPYALHYPELASDKQNAMEAFQRLIRNSGLSPRELARLARDENQRDAILQAISEEQQSPGIRSGEWETTRSRSYEDDNRTAGIGGGYSGGGRRAQTEDTSADSVGSVLRDIQKRGGWSR